MSQLRSTTPPFAIFACGNPSRGDDALGPLLLARLADWLATERIAMDFELLEDFQLQIEHALDMQGRQAVLFVDAGQGMAEPYALTPVCADDRPGHSTHAISPGAVLAVYRRIVGSEPPPARVLCVQGETFELGEGLTPRAAENLELAWLALQQWCLDQSSRVGSAFENVDPDHIAG